MLINNTFALRALVLFVYYCPTIKIKNIMKVIINMVETTTIVLCNYKTIMT